MKINRTLHITLEVRHVALQVGQSKGTSQTRCILFGTPTS